MPALAATLVSLGARPCARRTACSTHLVHARPHARACPHTRCSLLVIRICLFSAYVWLLINACTGIPLWPSVDSPGYLSLDMLIWAIINLCVHGTAMLQVRTHAGARPGRGGRTLAAVRAQPRSPRTCPPPAPALPPPLPQPRGSVAHLRRAPNQVQD